MASRPLPSADRPPRQVGLSPASLRGLTGSQFFSTAAQAWVAVGLLTWLGATASALGWEMAAKGAAGWPLAASLIGALGLGLGCFANAWDRVPPQGLLFVGRLLELAGALVAIGSLVQQSLLLLCLAGLLAGCSLSLTSMARHALLRQLEPEARLVWGNGLTIAATAAGFAVVLVALRWGGEPLAPGQNVDVWNLLVPLLLLEAGSILSTFAIHATAEIEPAPRLSRRPFRRIGELLGRWHRAKARRSLSLWLTFATAAGVYAVLHLRGIALETLSWPAEATGSLGLAFLLGWGSGALALGAWSQRAELGWIVWGWLAFIVAIGWLNLLPAVPPEIAKETGNILLSALFACFGLGAALAAIQLPMVAHLQRYDEPDMRSGLLTVTTLFAWVAACGVLGVFVWWERSGSVDRFASLPNSYQLSSLGADELATWDAVQRTTAEFSPAESPEAWTAGQWLDHAWRRWVGTRGIGDTLPAWASESTGAAARTNLFAAQAPPRAIVAAAIQTELRLRRAAGSEPRLGEYLDYFAFSPEWQLVAKNVYVYSAPGPEWTSRQRLFLAGLLALPLMAYAAWRLPQAMARVFFWTLFRLLYRVRVNGAENIPPDGGAVLVSNHTSWIDGLTMILMSGRKIRMIAWAANFNNPFMRFWGWFSGVILITGGPKSIQRGLAEARKALTRGELVGIFPEGGITRSGQIQGFRPGLMKILEKLPVPIVPVYIDQLWGSIYTYAGGKTIWRFPNSFRHRLTVNLGPPIRDPQSIHEVRQAVSKLSADCVANRQGPFECPAAKLVRRCKRRKFALKVSDSTDQAMSGGALLLRSLLLRRLLRRHVLAADESHVGLLIPPSSGGVLCNAALALDRRVAVNLNYTLTPRLINECIKQAGVRHVLTSRKVLEKLNLSLDCEVVYVEDLKEKVTWTDKLWGALQTYLIPGSWLLHGLGLANVPPHEPLTIIFTSGSTGIPKGVVLSQLNIASNVEAIYEAINLNAKDTLIGALPFFHSFGYTVTFWGVMGLDVRGVYHFNPLEATQIAKLTRKYQGTVLLGTPTFLRAYLKRCNREDFQTLSIVIAGAEKLPIELAIAFEHRFGIRPVEGFGATETAPIVAVNIPPSRSCHNFQLDNKEGTVGRTVANVAVKITDLADDRRELDVHQPGMLWVKGPNVMLGYLNRPDLTKEAIVDGWYKTGDVAEMDDEGFLKLTGRMSRFSKIGGEMIPHIQIEDALLGTYTQRDLDVPPLVVTSVPDPKKGERIVVLSAVLEKEPSEMCRALKAQGLPNLYIPSPDSFFRIEAVPVLGSGKLDLKVIKDLALQLTKEQADRATSKPE